jgi:acetyl esterase/lipase
MVVMIPELKHLLRDEMVPEEIDDLVAAFDYLRGQEFVDPERMGFIGFSAGAGLAMVAATDAGIAEGVDFVGSFGGYYDIFDVIAAATTETIVYDGRQEDWEPDSKTLSVLRRSLIYYADSNRDRDILTRIFLEGEADARERVDELSPDGLRIFELLDNRDPDRTDELLAALPPDDVATLRRLSPRYSMDDLQTEVFILHDRNDKLIPYVESRRLADAARAGNDVHYSELDIFHHVNPTVPTNPITFLADLIEFLFQAFRLMLRLL